MLAAAVNVRRRRQVAAGAAEAAVAAVPIFFTVTDGDVWRWRRWPSASRRSAATVRVAVAAVPLGFAASGGGLVCGGGGGRRRLCGGRRQWGDGGGGGGGGRRRQRRGGARALNETIENLDTYNVCMYSTCIQYVE